jgi:hypothetical protein
MLNEQVQNIESHLEQTFRRVTPSREFVNTVRGRMGGEVPLMAVRRRSSRRSALLTLSGVLSVSLLLLTVARLLFYLLGRSKRAA